MHMCLNYICRIIFFYCSVCLNWVTWLPEHVYYFIYMCMCTPQNLFIVIGALLLMQIISFVPANNLENIVHFVVVRTVVMRLLNSNVVTQSVSIHILAEPTLTSLQVM